MYLLARVFRPSEPTYDSPPFLSAESRRYGMHDTKHHQVGSIDTSMESTNFHFSFCAEDESTVLGTMDFL
jgi:hypothetical protein